jgi:hypothetical protein
MKLVRPGQKREARLGARCPGHVPAMAKMLSLVSKDGATGKNSGSDHRRDFFQPDQAGERAHFALLVLTQLEQ